MTIIAAAVLLLLLLLLVSWSREDTETAQEFR
eukprot:COSAG06_NODE_47197_length_341_cov_0.574380_1_plen_31_part_10